MPSKRQSITDSRGYIFQLPSLGLPDPEGHFVDLRVAIGTRQDATVALQDKNIAAPRRYASSQCTILPVEDEGALYFLPLVLPEHPSPKTEVFTIRVPRLWPCDHCWPIRLFLPPGLQLFAWMPPPGVVPFGPPASTTSVTPATEADEKELWEELFGENLPPDYAHGWAGTLRRFAKKGLWVLFCLLVALALLLWWTGNQAWKGLVFAWTSISGRKYSKAKPSSDLTQLWPGKSAKIRAKREKNELKQQQRRKKKKQGR